MDDKNPSQMQQQSIEFDEGNHLLRNPKQMQQQSTEFNVPQQQSYLLIPDLPQDFVLMCLARLSQRDRARCMCISRAFRKTLSDEELMSRVCEGHGIPYKEKRVFLCLGKTEIAKSGRDNEVRNTLIWLTLNPHTQELEMTQDLHRFGRREALGRDIRLAVGPHPGQIFIHGLVNNNPRYGCSWEQQSCIWSLDLYTRKMSFKGRLFRTNFAWANINSKIYVAVGRKLSDFYDNTLLSSAQCFYDTTNADVDLNGSSQYHSNDADLNGSSQYHSNDADLNGSSQNNSYELHEINLGCRKWHPISDINVPREFCAYFTLNGHFYLLGGVSKENGRSTRLTSAEFYNPDTNQWTLIPYMWPSSGIMPSVAVVNNELYAVKLYSTEILHFDASLNSWTKFANLPERCLKLNGFRLLGVDDELWVFVSVSQGEKFNERLGMELLVFSCRPCPGNTNVIWKELFTDKNIPLFHRLLDCVVIEI